MIINVKLFYVFKVFYDLLKDLKRLPKEPGSKVRRRVITTPWEKRSTTHSINWGKRAASQPHHPVKRSTTHSVGWGKRSLPDMAEKEPLPSLSGQPEGAGARPGQDVVSAVRMVTPGVSRARMWTLGWGRRRRQAIVVSLTEVYCSPQLTCLSQSGSVRHKLLLNLLKALKSHKNPTKIQGLGGSTRYKRRLGIIQRTSSLPKMKSMKLSQTM